MKYQEETDGVWIEPVYKAYKMMCCDCGLVHRVDFRIHRRQIQFRPTIDNRATGQARRWMRVKEGK